MGKKKIIIIAGFIGLLVITFFGFVIFSKKKTVQISAQEPVIEDQQVMDENQSVLSQQPDVSASQDEQTETNKQENETTTTKSQINNETKSSAGKIINRFISWGFQKASNRKIDTIIIHSTYDALGNDPYSIDGIIAEYKQYGVSAHYLIARNGIAYHLVADQNIAYHAGVSKMPDGRTDVNNFSIGIEMANTTEGKFTSDQYATLNRLIGDLKKQYSIKYILGHSDIAPGRKTDPWNIDWSKVNK